MSEVYVVSAMRSAIGGFGDSLVLCWLVFIQPLSMFARTKLFCINFLRRLVCQKSM